MCLDLTVFFLFGPFQQILHFLCDNCYRVPSLVLPESDNAAPDHKVIDCHTALHLDRMPDLSNDIGAACADLLRSGRVLFGNSDHLTATGPVQLR